MQTKSGIGIRNQVVFFIFENMYEIDYCWVPSFFLPVEVIAHWNFTSKCRKPLNESEVWGISRAFRLLRRTFCFVQVSNQIFFPTENI